MFEKFMQMTVEFFIVDKNGKEVTLKQGKIINFNIKPPFLHYRMVIKEKLRDYYLPMPFKHFDADEGYCLDYRLESICSDQKMIDKMLELGKMSDSKLFNTRLHIRQHDKPTRLLPKRQNT